MKLRITLILIAGFISGLLLHGQEIPDMLKKRNEIYFTFQVKNTSEINTLTNLISIDNVKGSQVWAYANIPQYLKFMKLGYDITLLPPPGDAQGIVMNDHIVLSPLTTWNFYPTYSAYESLMIQFQTMYPGICNLDTITTLASGRRLLVLKISDNVATDESEPEFLYTSSIHGDETTGYVLMLHLADYLLSNYGTNAEVTDMVNNMEIYICPLANPDGTYAGGNNSVSLATRYNSNGVDLNRNYPDFIGGQHPDGNAWQPETVAFMNFASLHHFVGACNFHGGVEVVNYPWDAMATLHPDDTWYQYISREYADTVHIHAPTGYMTYLNNGITNGYAWYLVYGGRQDWMNNYQHCREITAEISNTKLLAANLLEPHWTYNWRSFILLLKESKYGIQGIITDQTTGNPVAAKVFITGHDASNSEVYSSANPGDYHRPVKAGTYTLEISAPCYQTQTITGVTVSDHATLTLNIQLVPGPSAAVTTTAVTLITSSGATSGGNVTCTGSTAVTARGVCWGTSASPQVTGSHTTNGSGPGIFTSQLTGLSPSTLYYVRAYATNSSGTYYGSDIQFTTTCSGTITAFPWNEGFENGGVIPGCWTQEMVNASGISWTFIAGSGNSHPAGAHGGTLNACLKDVTPADNKTRLITPPLNLTFVSSPQLKFWHTQAVWSGDQDQLTVFYKTSSGGTWTPIGTYTASITAWTLETIILPNPSGEYYIAFEGNAKYGYGVCVDDVQVSTSCASTVPVSVSIAASANPVCQGSTVTFTATPANGGTTPAYQWKVNGTNVSGASSVSYVYAPATNDQVTCVLTSNASCITGNPATSNTITMTVTPVLPVSVSITASGNPVCAGTSVTFNPAPVNGGTPSYQWFKNTLAVGTGAAYTCIPVNGDQVYAIMTSSLACKTGSPATSNTLTIMVNAVLPVEVTISANANPVPSGLPVTFTASPVNGGAFPSYQWKVNDGNTGTDSPVYTYIPANGDVVSCLLNSDANCATGNPAVSNQVTMVVNDIPAAIDIQNLTIADVQCFNATQTITVAGNGTTFTVSTGGSATMIAGQNIIYLPGTVVDPGGYMYGYITAEGLYCNTQAHAIVSAHPGKSELLSSGEQPFFKIYPNPTCGVFSIEFSGVGQSEEIGVEIYGMRGEKVLSASLTGEQKHRFSLAGKAEGIYLVRVISAKGSAATRIIKQD
ncbi:MAG: M14 family zinc carboxypeptidase [Bacteroidetes bacterium]|nr:M14 family zinc carboxypeptidase [Bacteroidota bacterium]